MPVYNASRHLREAMDSILGQSFGDFEFLCIDDGSTDDSTKILRDYAQRDKRVIILIKSNGGVTSALNAGLKVARGEFVARMDADDIADPNRFAAQVAHMRDHPEVVAVGCHVIHMNADGVDTHHSPPYTTHEEITACLWEGNSSAIPHYGSFMRRSALTQIGNYREEFRTAQDLDLFLRMSEIGKLANVPQYLMHYRVHEGSVGARRAEEQARNAREILRQAYERRGQKLPRHLAKWSNVVVSTNRLRWGWAALEEKRYADARAHAWSVLKNRPFRRFSYQLAFHAALGPWRESLRGIIRKTRKVAKQQPSELTPVLRYSEEPGPSPRQTSSSTDYLRTGVKKPDPGALTRSQMTAAPQSLIGRHG
jgi:glycosyltransferase involved in cell wall biosynthesis